jgi:hypothetical protein
MNKNIVHTIRPKNYDYLSKALADVTLASDVMAALLEMIKEHQLVTIAALQKRKEQIKDALGLFASLERGNRLFPEPDCPEPAENPEPEVNENPLDPIKPLGKRPKKPVSSLARAVRKKCTEHIKNCHYYPSPGLLRRTA